MITNNSLSVSTIGNTQSKIRTITPYPLSDSLALIDHQNSAVLLYIKALTKWIMYDIKNEEWGLKLKVHNICNLDVTNWTFMKTMESICENGSFWILAHTNETCVQHAMINCRMVNKEIYYATELINVFNDPMKLTWNEMCKFPESSTFVNARNLIQREYNIDIACLNLDLPYFHKCISALSCEVFVFYAFQQFMFLFGVTKRNIEIYIYDIISKTLFQQDYWFPIGRTRNVFAVNDEQIILTRVYWEDFTLRRKANCCIGTYRINLLDLLPLIEQNRIKKKQAIIVRSYLLCNYRNGYHKSLCQYIQTLIKQYFLTK